MPSIRVDPTYDGTIVYVDDTSERGEDSLYLDDSSDIITCAKTTSGENINYYRGFLDFDTSGLRESLNFRAIKLRTYVSTLVASPTGSVTNMSQPAVDYEDLADLYADVGATSYLEYTPVTGWNTIDLGADALADFISHPTWFSVGIKIIEVTGKVEYIRSMEYATTTLRPQLIIYTSSAPIAYDGGGSMRY